MSDECCLLKNPLASATLPNFSRRSSAVIEDIHSVTDFDIFSLVLSECGIPRLCADLPKFGLFAPRFEMDNFSLINLACSAPCSSSNEMPSLRELLSRFASALRFQFKSPVAKPTDLLLKFILFGSSICFEMNCSSRSFSSSKDCAYANISRVNDVLSLMDLTHLPEPRYPSFRLGVECLPI